MLALDIERVSIQSTSYYHKANVETWQLVAAGLTAGKRVNVDKIPL